MNTISFHIVLFSASKAKEIHIYYMRNHIGKQRKKNVSIEEIVNHSSMK